MLLFYGSNRKKPIDIVKGKGQLNPLFVGRVFFVGIFAGRAPVRLARHPVR